MKTLATWLTLFVWLPFAFSMIFRTPTFGVTSSFEQSESKFLAAITLTVFLWGIYGFLHFVRFLFGPPAKQEPPLSSAPEEIQDASIADRDTQPAPATPPKATVAANAGEKKESMSRRANPLEHLSMAYSAIWFC